MKTGNHNKSLRILERVKEIEPRAVWFHRHTSKEMLL